MQIDLNGSHGVGYRADLSHEDRLLGQYLEAGVCGDSADETYKALEGLLKKALRAVGRRRATLARKAQEE